MDQRRLRLGDILDDYCPRERRITNHAVVAMVADDVKQTRCTTCDAEHEYKHAKVPAARRRKTETPAAHLVDAASKIPAETPDTHEDISEIDIPVMAEAEAGSGTDSGSGSESGSEEQIELAAAPETSVDAAVVEPDAIDEGPAGGDESDNWPVHRPLIRAQLPRPEGHVPERKAPDFTFRPGGGRFDPNRDPNRNGGQRHRGHRPGRQAHGGGQPSGQGSSRFGGQRGPGQGGGGGPHGQRQGNRPGQGGSGRPGQGQGRGPRPGGGRKRGR
jgi:hypothetical protein